MLKRIVGAFHAVSEEVATRGGLFGYAGHHAQAFCDVVGKLPVAQQVMSGFGKIKSFTRFVSGNTSTRAKKAFAHALSTLGPNA